MSWFASRTDNGDSVTYEVHTGGRVVRYRVDKRPLPNMDVRHDAD